MTDQERRDAVQHVADVEKQLVMRLKRLPLNSDDARAITKLVTRHFDHLSASLGRMARATADRERIARFERATQVQP